MAVLTVNSAKPSKGEIVFGKRVQFHNAPVHAGRQRKHAFGSCAELRQGDAERRSNSRMRSYKSGRMVFNHGNSTIDCVIHDVAVGGVRLDTASTLNVPKTFDLLKQASGRVQLCQVVWRGMGQIGVRYI